jgi:hypothetical protein
MIAYGETVGRHPMIGEGEGRCEIGRAPARCAVDAGLEGIALAAAESLRQAPIGAGAGKREADDCTGRQMIVESSRAARRASGQVVAAAHGEIAGGAVAAAIGSTPHGPARLIDRHRLRRRLQYRGIGVGNVGRHGFAFGRKAERRVICPSDATAPIDEGVEHQVEELVDKLESDFLRAGRGFAGKLVQRSGEIVAGQAEERHKGRRQRATVVEEVVNRQAGVELVGGEGW